MVSAMKLFFVGGSFVQSGSGEGPPDEDGLRSSMRELGAFLAGQGHDLVLCSPYEGSIDLEILKGAAASGARPRIEMHFPEMPDILEAVRQEAAVVNLDVHEFSHAAQPSGGEQGMRYAWLLSQLSALDSAHVVVAAAGNPAGSANMLLHLAEARRCPILPFGHLGGAAARALERQRYVLEDKLGDLRSWLLSPTPMDRVGEALDRLTAPALARRRTATDSGRFFISYARPRVTEADLVETLLRRREHTVFRDDQAFDPSAELTQEIERAIRSSQVFVALWSADYACSPWCHDELALALELREEEKLSIWLLQLDDTRVVPPGARKLISQPCRTRDELRSTMLKLLES